jgi:hypothetical protein
MRRSSLTGSQNAHDPEMSQSVFAEASIAARRAFQLEAGKSSSNARVNIQLVSKKD